MARMVPSPMRPTESTAEAYLYGKFERELPPEVTVVHGARWVGTRHRRRGEDGEADFVILHPTDGILVLEAKSDTIRRDGARGTWFRAVGGGEEEMDDPVQQACDSKHALRALLEGMPGVSSRCLHPVHGIALPFQTVPPEGLGWDVPRSRILDAYALGNLPAYLRGALESADPRRGDLPPLGADGVARVADALSPTREPRVHLGRVAEAVRDRVVRLTEEQFDVLDWLSRVPRAFVTGGPGTGKSLLAAELSRRLAVQGKRVLLVCFNGPLAGWLKDAVGAADGVTTATFHEFCRLRGRAAGYGDRVAEAEGSPRGYDDDFPTLLLDAADRLSDPASRFDAIVVDEAQDFHPHWWTALEAWLGGGRDGLLYAFHDGSQDVYRREGSFPAAELGFQGPFPLTRNCRNPDEIHAILRALAPESVPPRPSGIASGRRPRLQWVTSKEEVVAAAGRAVDRLLAERLPPQDIVVLSPHSAQTSALGSLSAGSLSRLGRAPVSWRERASPAHVLVDTIHRFKGLESVAVVLVEIDPDSVPALPPLLRVGISRAQVSLEVLASASARTLLSPALSLFSGV